MKRALLTKLSVCTRKLLLSPPRLNPNPRPSLAQLTVSTRSRLSRFYSSECDSSCEARLTQKSNGSIEDADELSTQEIKRLVEKYYEGEDESLPLIFEAIINRKLAGIPDDKLIEQLNLESPTNGFEDKEFDFDFEDKWSETDEDGDELD
ncbi:PREDICTED: uncharacterized protein LOC105135803 [Populus euphratica]|uniref:Uncharacterized protein LOC105119391 n=1 Tax=Populus euphratica TaxID=75702 RepID=A0AAJ6V0U0_POPEU|nr:PREDICTED: uncharacterized protein LOC105119391 [Populus euphratica]XP_011015830.1 PREDICTED: uncharacterized protein LOC105119391 [Populus euphratica]XP_011015831.1 PREDICTED: uncharacterized protein LOC105119391 [Populus euphratica]XP_011015832.1 PREDICTED: uncharacterized protein LOC105119391 [Populus euphratica]XP_011039146.1 PREDICTED: uncharacterized protein LOC105135803 [Populus euphratica]XP_011039147.1 PREDICTED: uncharacterized protein LOC105135803 [Populus euphratica]XP_01103914